MDSNYGLKVVFSFQIYHGSYLTPKSIFFFLDIFLLNSFLLLLEEFFKHPLQPLKLQNDIPRFQKYIFVYFIARAQNHYTLLCGLLMVFNTCIYCTNYNVQAVIHFFISRIKMKIKLIDEASFVKMQNITCASICHYRYLFGQPRI